MRFKNPFVRVPLLDAPRPGIDDWRREKRGPTAGIWFKQSRFDAEFCNVEASMPFMKTLKTHLTNSSYVEQSAGSKLTRNERERSILKAIGDYCLTCNVHTGSHVLHIEIISQSFGNGHSSTTPHESRYSGLRL